MASSPGQASQEPPVEVAVSDSEVAFGSRLVSPPNNTGIALIICGTILFYLLAGIGGIAYLVHLRHRVSGLEAQQVQVKAVAQTALKTAQGIPMPKDFAPDIARIEGTVQNRFRLADDAQKTFQAELDQVRALENKVDVGDKANANEIASAATALQQLRERTEKHEENAASVIAILRNQEQIIRQLIQRETPSVVP